MPDSPIAATPYEVLGVPPDAGTEELRRAYRRMLRETLEERLARLNPTLTLSNRPAVVLVVGVNGVGKTTTIGKFSKFLVGYGRTVIVGAADTFRAAAVEQLATWAERGGALIQRPQQVPLDCPVRAYA